MRISQRSLQKSKQLITFSTHLAAFRVGECEVEDPPLSRWVAAWSPTAPVTSANGSTARCVRTPSTQHKKKPAPENGTG